MRFPLPKGLLISIGCVAVIADRAGAKVGLRLSAPTSTLDISLWARHRQIPPLAARVGGRGQISEEPTLRPNRRTTGPPRSPASSSSAKDKGTVPTENASG